MQEIISGLNYKRKQFNYLMEMIEFGQVKRLILARRDCFVASISGGLKLL